MGQATREFRPWGRFDQLLNTQQDSEWSLIACCSHEYRCRAVFECISELDIFGPQLVFEIRDPLSVSTDKIKRKIAENLAYITKLGFQDQLVSAHYLIDPFSGYESALRKFLDKVDDRNLIIDVTSLPKKIYFFLTKLLFGEFNLPRNVVFTYAEPRMYSNKPLAENPDPWEALPGFLISPQDENDRKIVVSIGYEPLGLPDLVNSGRFDKTQMIFLFPFPAQADRVARNWRFIRSILPNPDSDQLSVKRVDGINIPEVFQALLGIGEHGEQGLILAPFGPKPVSMAMALYAAKYSHSPNQTGVYYTQPTYYNPEYTTGVRKIDGRTALNAYCVKLNGHFVY